MSTLADRRRRFRALHERGCFVIPNPWDVGTTRWLASLGFEIDRFFASSPRDRVARRSGG